MIAIFDIFKVKDSRSSNERMRTPIVVGVYPAIRHAAMAYDMFEELNEDA